MPVSLGVRSLNYGSPVNRAAPLNQGLAHWWKAVPWRFGGPVVTDLMRGQHGQLISTAVWSAVPHPGGHGAVRFDTTTAYVVAAPLLVLADAQHATMSGWLYRRTTGELVGFGPYWQPNRFSVVWYSDGNVYCSVDNGATADYLYIAEASTGWHHIIMTFDGTLATASARVVMYWDGALATVAGFGGGGTFPATLPSAVNQVEMRWGMDRLTGSTRFWGGMVDDVRIYPRTLSAQEARGLYLAALQGYTRELQWQVWPPVWASTAAVGGGGKAAPPRRTPWRFFRRAA